MRFTFSSCDEFCLLGLVMTRELEIISVNKGSRQKKEDRVPLAQRNKTKKANNRIFKCSFHREQRRDSNTSHKYGIRALKKSSRFLLILSRISFQESSILGNLHPAIIEVHNSDRYIHTTASSFSPRSLHRFLPPIQTHPAFDIDLDTSNKSKMSSFATGAQSSQSLSFVEETDWTDFNCDQLLDTTMFDSFLLEDENIDVRDFALSPIKAPGNDPNLKSGVSSSVEPQAASSISSTTSLPDVVGDVADNCQDVAAATTVAMQQNLDAEHAPPIFTYSSDASFGNQNGNSDSMSAFQTPRYMPFTGASHPGHSAGYPTAQPEYLPLTPPSNQGCGMRYPISPSLSYGLGFPLSALQPQASPGAGNFLSPQGNAGAPFVYPPPPDNLREFQFSCFPRQPWGPAPPANMIAQHNFSSMTPPGRQVSSIQPPFLSHGDMNPPGAPRKFPDHEQYIPMDFATSPNMGSRKRAYNGNSKAAKKPRSYPSFEHSEEMGFDAPPNTVSLGPKGTEPKEVRERLMDEVKTKRCSYVARADSQRPQASAQLGSYVRRSRNPGRQISIPQTPEVLKRNAARREHYRRTLTPQQRKIYDRNAALARGQAVNI